VIDSPQGSNRLSSPLNVALSRRIESLVGRDHEREKAPDQPDQVTSDSHPSPIEDDLMYDVFLNLKATPAFPKEDLWRDYISFKRSDGHIPLQVFILVMMGLYVGARFWFAKQAGAYTRNPTALLAICLAVFTTLVAMGAVFLKLSLVSVTYNIRPLQRFHSLAVRFFKSRFGQWLDTGTVVGAGLTVGLYMVAQALAPVCRSKTTIVLLQRCTQDQDDAMIAPEVMVLAVTVVIVFQMLARGVNRLGLVVAWVVMIVTINVSLWLVGSQSYLWINGELACLIALSYELERMPLRQFIKSLRVVEASEVNAHLRVAVVQYQVREGERALEAKRSMVRHIGHGTFCSPSHISCFLLCTLYDSLSIVLVV
jgi:hypothetical protein